MPRRSLHWTSPILSNKRNRIAKQPVLKRWRRDDRQCFKRRREKRRLGQMKKKGRQRGTLNAGRRSVKKTQVNVHWSGQTRRLVLRRLHKGSTNLWFVIACRRGQYKEKEDNCRGSESQATVKGEKGRTCNSYHKACPDHKFEDNDHDEAAVYYIAQPSYELQGSAGRETYHQTCSSSCLGQRQRQNAS